MTAKTELPKNLSLGRARHTQWGWEMPVHVGAGVNQGNCLFIVSLGGYGGTSSARDRVEAFAARLIELYNGASDETPPVAVGCRCLRCGAGAEWIAC